MSDWLQRALLRSEYLEEVLFARSYLDADDQSWEVILAQGLMTEAMPADQAWCPHCGDELCELSVIPFHAGTTLYWNCSQCGPLEIETDNLRRWRFCFDCLPHLLRSQLSLTGSIQELVPRRVWQLGRRCLRGASITYVLSRGLCRRDAMDLLANVKLPHRAVLLVPAKLPSQRVIQHLGCPVIPLIEVLSWQDAMVQWDLTMINDHLPSPSLAAPVPRRRKRAGRAAAIEVLKQQLTEHLRASRDYALEALDLQGQAVLLPRPSQKQLASLTGLTEVTVSRCLRDPAARELHLLWNTADDLDSVLRLPATTRR